MLENIQYYEPTRFMGVTRIFEKIEEGIRGREAELTGLKRAVFNWAQRQALHHHKQEESQNRSYCFAQLAFPTQIQCISNTC